MKKNLRKKALVPALAMALAAVIALSGVTYAWFTTGTTANVNNLNVNVQTANGIQLSLDGKSWKSTITTKEILAAIEGAKDYSGRCIQFPTGEIAPVSSAGVVTNGKLEMFYGEYNEDGTLKSVAQIDQNDTVGQYIAFDLFFKYSGNQALSLNVGKGQSVVTTISLDEAGKATILTDEADMGMVIDTVKRAEDSNDVIIRLYEPLGSRRSAALRFGRPVRSICRTNLAEREDGEPLSLESDGTLAISAAPRKAK